ncbi:MAG TPA: hypothetical protein DCZ49_04360 [Hyphomonadaceae bacterium]|nr:hypothetical protein [Hyphomonadaceae bacterium]
MTTLIDALAARSGKTHPLVEAAAGCGGSCATGPQPAARRGVDAPPVRVNGIVIDEADIARESQHHTVGSIEEARAAAAQALIVRHLLLERAGELSLAPRPETDPLGRWESDDEALVRAVLDLEAAPIEPTEAECRRVYAAQSARFAMPFERAEPIIRDRLRARAWMTSAAAYVARLYRSARIEGLDRRPEGPP